MKKQVGNIILLLALAGAAVGYWLYARPTPDVVQARPDETLSAAALVQAFQKQAAAADQRLQGKVLRVSGIVRRIQPSGAVVLASGSGPSEVVVGLDERHREDAALLRAGRMAMIQGIYSGYEQHGGDPSDLLAALGTTIHLRSAGVVQQ